MYVHGKLYIEGNSHAFDELCCEFKMELSRMRWIGWNEIDLR